MQVVNVGRDKSLPADSLLPLSLALAGLRALQLHLVLLLLRHSNLLKVFKVISIIKYISIIRIIIIVHFKESGQTDSY